MAEFDASFFSRQDAARRSSFFLLLGFVAAVLFILLLADAAFGLAFWRFQPPDAQALLWQDWTWRALFLPLFLIGLGSLIGLIQMRTGGHAVAAMVGATPVPFTAGDQTRRRLINIVEEMAIAAGIRVPALYVMEQENGINAFVAGLTMDSAVLVVTRGAIDFLERDELQGVIGHEFSHILNGDMRLNMRLIAILTGLLIMSQTGGFMLRAGRSTRSQLSIPFLLLGGALWPLGYAGLFTGRLIKAAISRQRETLADACSVQFTRNPDGLAGALLKIRDQAEGSLLCGFHAEAMSHMCFGPTLNMARWYATHPPIDARIEAIAPHFLLRKRARRRRDSIEGLVAATRPQQGRVDQLERPWLELAPIEFGSLVQRVGTVSPAQVEAVAQLRQQLPELVAQALQTCDGAKALLYALIAGQQAVGATDIRMFFRDRESAAFGEQVLALRQVLPPPLIALPLVDMALPRLSLLDQVATRQLLGGLQAFSELDHRLSVFEFALLTLARERLLPGRPRQGRADLATLRQPFSVVVAVLLRQDALPPAEQQTSYAAAFAGLGEAPALPTGQDAGLPRFALALRELALLDASGKQLFMARCAQVVQADGVFSAGEYELMRVIGALVGCPLPLALLHR